MSVLKTHDLQVSIGTKIICRLLNIDIHDQQTWAILGSNGVGKTTLLHCLAGLHSPDRGQIDLLGKPISALQRKDIAQHLGILFQHQAELFPATVMETALIGRHPFLNRWQWETPEDIVLAKHALKTVDLNEFSQRQTDSLSGGENQRLKVATLLAQNPKIMLLDEPTNHLDLNYQIKILAILTNKVKTEGGALVMALHDINLAARFCSHAMLINPDGEILTGSIDRILQPTTLSKTYGCPIIRLASPSGSYFIPR